MKNYWLESYRRKQTQLWTVEFHNNGTTILSPRRALVQDPHYSLSDSNSSKRVGLVFEGAMYQTSDHELMDFLTHSANHGMTSVYSFFRKFRDVASTRETMKVELTDLSYDSLGMGPTPDDIKLSFYFKHIRRYIYGN